MKRRDFLKMSLSAGVAAALPFNVMSLSSCCESSDEEMPDISGFADLLILGNIITVDEKQLFAEAMTIKNGYVQFVGTRARAKLHCDQNTRKIDYGSLSVYPGFMEAHCHGSNAGLLDSTCKLFNCNSFEEYKTAIKQYINERPGQDVYRISGWRNIGGTPPTRLLLDEVTPGDAVILGTSMDGHCFLINSNGLKLIEDSDPTFFDGYDEKEVPRDTSKRPTGYFTESAAQNVQKLVPIDLEVAKRSVMNWQQFAFKNGFVAAAEAGVNLSPIFAKAYAQLAKEKKLQLRTRAFWNVVMSEATEAKVKEIEQMTKEQNDEYYKIIGLKLFIDGVVESHTALLSERYADEDTLGLDRYRDATGDPDATLKKVVLEAHKRGLPTHTHTIGDGAVKKMLDAIEYAKNTTGDFSIRDMLAHIELVRTEDIKRFAQLNVSAITAALWGPLGSITPIEEEEKYLGDRAHKNYEVMNTFVKHGVNCAQHTDYPVSQAFGVPHTIYCGVTRQLPGKGKVSERLAEEAVTRLEILKEMTINVAKLWNEENHMGTLTRGKVANFVVYDVDFIDDDAEKIPYANLKHVVVDGKEVYQG